MKNTYFKYIITLLCVNIFTQIFSMELSSLTSEEFSSLVNRLADFQSPIIAINSNNAEFNDSKFKEELKRKYPNNPTLPHNEESPAKRQKTFHHNTMPITQNYSTHFNNNIIAHNANNVTNIPVTIPTPSHSWQCKRPRCTSSFETEETLLAHDVMMHQRISCPVPGCGSTFSKSNIGKGRQISHIKKTHPQYLIKNKTQDKSSYTCNECGCTFTRHDNLKRHIENFHPNTITKL